MFKAARWRSVKNKNKIVFKLQLQATQVPLPGSEAVTVNLIPLDVGKPTVRSERVSAVGGTCNWLNPIYETVKLRRDPKSGKINEKLYKFLVSTAGSDRAGLLGEATVNLADYAEVFKASSISLPLKAGAILHVTIQRMQADVGGRSFRGNEQNGDATVKPEGRTLKSQLRECDSEEGAKSLIGRNDTNLLKDDLRINRESRIKFQSSRNLPTYADSGSRLNESHGFDAISIATSDDSSNIYTPRDNSFTNGGIQKNSTMLLSPLANIGIGLNSITGSGDWSGTFAPDRSTDGSTNNSEESGLTGVQCSDDTIERIRCDVVLLTRKVEVSEVELQTLRKQIVKENRRGQDLCWEINSLKEERDALRRECQELKLAQKKANESQIDTKDPSSILEEIKQELDDERNLNSSLHLQLQKTQEANSELLLAVRDLDDLLAQKNGEATPCHKCGKMDVKTTSLQGMELGSEVQQLQQFECKQEFLGKILKSDESQYPLGVLVNEHNRMSVAYSLKKKIIDLNSEIELYKKGREDLEMQMEQLALDYEILKQENHDVSSKLEQTQLREQLRMQYECSAHSAIIAELEAHVECIEKEIHTQAESFESNIDSIMKYKIEQEKKFLQAEEALRKTKWNNLSITEQLHEKLVRLSSQVSSVFYDNEKIVKQALKEASDLRLQRSHLERTLEKTKENLVSLQNKYSMSVRQLLGILNFKSKETDKLQLELKKKNEELESYKKIQEARQKDSSEKMQLLQTEIEKLKMETCLISEQKEKLVDEIGNLGTTNQGNEIMLQQVNLENRILKQEKSLLKQEVEKSLEEINGLRIMRNETEKMVSMLNVEVETIGMQCNDLKRSLSEGESEKEKLRRLVSHLTGGLLKEESTITRSEEELNNSNINGETRFILSSSHILKDRKNEVTDMGKIECEFNRKYPTLSEEDVLNRHMKNEDKHCHKSCKGSGTSEFQIDILQPRVGVKVEINDTERRGQEFDRSYSQAISEKQPHIVTYPCDQHKVPELLSTMAVLKEQNESMEADLKEMQERYSEISLKFAEVEGERQQLVMTIRSLKNALKS